MKNKIKLNTTKTVVKLVLCVVFLLGAIYMISFGSIHNSGFLRNLYFVKLAGFSGTVLFSFFTYGLLKIYKNRNSAVVFTAEGFSNKTSIFYDGLVKWRDIKHIKKVKYRSNTMIVIKVKNEYYYLKKVPNRFLRFIARQNSNVLGSFLFIASDDLAGFTPDDLEVYLKLWSNL